MKDGIITNEKRYCCTCRRYAKFEGVCCNGESEYCTEFMCLDDSCDKWEGNDRSE